MGACDGRSSSKLSKSLKMRLYNAREKALSRGVDKRECLMIIRDNFC